MKSFLKGADGTFFPLLPKVTTIGRENCDFTIQLPGVDFQHCVIEYSEQDDCFVIQDLNTGQGTYVNDVRVQNAAVRLAPGDHIRFGYNGQPFELHVDNSMPMSLPPSSQRPPIWAQPMSVMNEQNGYNAYAMNQQAGVQGLPHITYATNIPQQGVVWSQASSQAPLPRPPLRSRPLSAGAVRRNVQNMNVPPVGPAVTRTTMVGGWVNNPITRTSSIPDVQAQEKDQRISQLTDELTRLRTFEFESVRKDTLIQQLQQQITDLQNKIRQEPSVIMGETDMSAQLFHLETEVTAKKSEITELKEQLSRLQTDRSSSPHLLRQELGERVKEVTQLRNELKRVKKDKNITSGLVTQMQRDMSNKDYVRSSSRQNNEHVKNDQCEMQNPVSTTEQTNTQEHPISSSSQTEQDVMEVSHQRTVQETSTETSSSCDLDINYEELEEDSTISRLTRDIEVLKKELRERDAQLATTSARRGKESPKQAEENSAREKELVTLRQKFKTAENKIQEQSDLIVGLQMEIEKMRGDAASDKENQKKVQSDLESVRHQLTDIQRSERVVRVDLEQSQKRIERFKSRVVQVTFSTPGLKMPESEISDDELIESLKKMMEERAGFLAKIKELEDEVVKSRGGKDELLGHAEKLKEALESCAGRLKEKGRLCSSLKQEMTIVQSLSTDSSLMWMRDLVSSLLESEFQWEQLTEEALEKCGINIKISNNDPSKHIATLYEKWESSLVESEKLLARVAELESGHQVELAALSDKLISEWKDRLKDAVEKACLEGEEKLNRAIDDIRLAENEKRDSAVEMERRKISELEETLTQLRNSMTEKQSEDAVKLEEAKLALEELESLRSAELLLKEELSAVHKLRIEETEKFTLEKEEYEKKFNADIQSYQEQIKQHSVTICTLEEKLEKLMKKNKDVQEQLSKLRSEKAQKPQPAPKPKVIVQRPRDEIAALEHVVHALRQENTVLKKEIRDSQDVIMGLRRDLSGASARLSDISGEMSEAQKQEMERNRELLTQRSNELTELRQQMAKLSKIVDSQKEELKKLEEELSKEKSNSAQYRNGLEEHLSRNRMLEDELNREKLEQKKQLELIDEEGRITSELTSMGAKCRGERHEQIIGRQREALSELRSKVKALEQSRPPLPSQDQALQQVVLLKKELAEMRVNQALAEDKIIQSATSLDREIGKARGLITPSNVEADMERSAHRETMDALEASEATYLTLLRAMAACLDLEEIEGLRPMAHIPRDERDSLQETRERACQLLANRIQVLKERIARKDELLQGYEQDLSRLRQSTEIAERKSQQVEHLANDVRSKSEESQYLRESLNRCRDRLNQEKRLNTAIKQKKTFHLENERSHLQNSGRKGPHCKIPDPRESVVKKQQKEMLRKKNYEIKTLKSDLCETEKELFHKEKRLMSLEAMSMEKTPC